MKLNAILDLDMRDPVSAKKLNSLLVKAIGYSDYEHVMKELRKLKYAYGTQTDTVMIEWSTGNKCIIYSLTYTAGEYYFKIIYGTSVEEVMKKYLIATIALERKNNV
jgi:hypothetical protein